MTGETSKTTTAFEQYENALRQFQDVESGVVEAGDIVKQMDEAHALNVQIQSEKAANAFINDLNPADMTAPIGIMANPTQAWPKIFDAPNAVEQITELYARADEIGDPLIKAGIQSNYLKHLQNKITTAQTMGVGPNNIQRSTSPAQLAKILENDFNGTLRTLEAVFANKPQYADQVKGLLGLINQVANQTGVRLVGECLSLIRP